jgi:hypothetical protein
MNGRTFEVVVNIIKEGPSRELNVSDDNSTGRPSVFSQLRQGIGNTDSLDGTTGKGIQTTFARQCVSRSYRLIGKEGGNPFLL